MTEKLAELTCKDCKETYTPASAGFLGITIRMDGGRCSKCKMEALKAWEAEEAALKAQEIAAQRLKWRRGSGIPVKFLTAEFGTWDKDRPGNVDYAYKKCLKYAEGFPICYFKEIIEKEKPAYPSLMLMSPWVDAAQPGNGVGKTHLVAAIANNIFNRWKGETAICPVKFITEGDLFNSIQATFGYSAEDRKRKPSLTRIIEILTYIPLLIIDDIGKEQRKNVEFVQSQLFALINARYNADRPVILTTNLNTIALGAHLEGDAEAITDRLIEMCGKDYFIEMTGESYRRR
ncbi:hypothetical protein LCGC14_2366720 [marine sediment metagenome]|uniref:IstB-like ATP-binding domain-containing protein n=1 Tax=marine sediment metagenome TaxID=412755 RepID=A0A0F9EZT2_9ZZZZ